MNEQTAQKPGKGRWILLGILVTVFLVGIAAFVLLGVNRFTLSVIPAGRDEITLNYGEDYAEEGAALLFRGSLFWKEGFAPAGELTIAGQVDTSRVGTYDVTYSGKFLWWEASAIRSVRVVDSLPPVITLTENPEQYTIYGEDYEEQGFRAYDEYDGDITHLVVRTERDGVVTYVVEDSSGNRAEASRTIRYHDPLPPVVTLMEGDQIRIDAGSPFVEPGFAAVDNHDGDVTQQVTVEGTVNHFIAGTYTLAYTVTDSFGNTTVATRVVEVVPKPQPAQVTPEGKVIYLTFDDGPGAYTDYLLAVLDKYGAKATFFVVDDGNYAAMKKIVEHGHAIGIHSVTHDYYQIYASPEAYFADLYAMQEIIYQHTGVKTTIMRFPGGSSNTVSRFNPGIMSLLTQAVEDAGFQYFDWNVDSRDAGGVDTAQDVYENVTGGIYGKRIAIVLQHDVKGYSVEAVERIIVWGLANGYTFLALDSTSPTAHHGVNN